MLYFYISVILLFFIAVACLVKLTSHKSEYFNVYTRAQNTGQLKTICTKYVLFITLHILFFLISQFYVLWCAINAFKLLSIYQIDSLCGLLLLTVISTSTTIKRVLIATVAKKSVLHL